MRRGRRTVIGVLGGAATVLLHSLFFAVAIWGTGSAFHPVRPLDAMGAGANTGSKDGQSSERRLTVRLDMAVDPSEQPPADLEALLTEAVKQSMLEVTGPNSLPVPPLVFQTEGEESESTDAELMARTQFAGIYESQVRARIQRMWEQTQGERPDAKFSCLVTIRQQRDGRIKDLEMDLQHCNGTPQSQMALANAIFSASPLPGPPHPSAYVDRFSLVFRGDVLMH